ncbi:uncharacterized protein RCC_01287 [Ramularia collo-cygni]|uniref:Xylanolytic transcriptional activator regulatory domain-containing protein n=1 Tax=Ramularia collo-cygni TaxID=112498 RepID=A0A2D3UP13_9PEZI|nr:uncharacterized protein RCC_01287 [Ramularia collo-cygni]CZT15428.1 uncharacterized protein RCC_01287 [Ramularia collo-cygni]
MGGESSEPTTPEEVQPQETVASPPPDLVPPPFPAACAWSPTHHTGSPDSWNTKVANESRTRTSAVGELIYLGDSADSSLLEDIRSLAQNVGTPPKPSLDEARNLIQTFLWVTTSFLDLFDEVDLERSLEHWATAPTGHEQHRDQDTIYFLIFAIAAQADPTDKDSLADKYFAYGRYLVACHYSEQPSTTAIQAYMLIAMYLLTAARRDAAFMYTGLATRAAYRIVRQRLWKVIFQEILDDVYSERHVSSDVLRKISNHQREWTIRLREGLEHDGIQQTDFVGAGEH